MNLRNVVFFQYEHKATDRQSIVILKNTIKDNITCIRMQPEQGLLFN